MAVEIKSGMDDIRWPGGVRLPVVLTFEHQSGEGAPLFPGDRPNYMVGGAMQYGARRGIWNILELLDKYQIKATFFVCGTTAEKYPEAVQAAVKSGHEIAGMSYSFDRVRTLSAERERSIVRQSAEVLERITGARIRGWRCPDYRVSPQTHDILAEEGFARSFGSPVAARSPNGVSNTRRAGNLKRRALLCGRRSILVNLSAGRKACGSQS